jgi:CheY-like chemotaxis protein
MIVIRTARATAIPDAAQGGERDGVELQISDTGCGISRDIQARLFEPFFTTKCAGHGLGLAVVQRIVQELGGAVEFEAEAGRGTTFRILLPSKGETTLPTRVSSVAAMPEALDHHSVVLMVEDETPLRLGVADMLRMKNFSVIEAADGTQALELIREHKNDIAVVLLDITLPGAPSHEVLAEVRRLRPDVKVIVTSAYGQSKVDSSFPGMKIDSFLRKPYGLLDVVNQVQILLPAENRIRANEL